MFDLAAKTLQNAIKEKLVFDDEKKELIYNLGSVLESMSKKEDAIEQFKLIYEVDSGYKDVGQQGIGELPPFLVLGIRPTNYRDNPVNRDSEQQQWQRHKNTCQHSLNGISSQKNWEENDQSSDCNASLQ